MDEELRSTGRIATLAGFPLVRLDVSPTAVFPLIITNEFDDIFSSHARIVSRAKVAELGLDSRRKTLVLPHLWQEMSADVHSWSRQQRSHMK